MNYYIADPHFGHANIIRLCGRPFADIDEMDETLIANWNKKVHRDDQVFILGDLMFRSRKSPVDYLERLKGKKILVLGNHDAHWLWQDNATRLLDAHVSMMEVMDKNERAVLCHYPMLTWPGFHNGAYMVYGHIHGNRQQDPYLCYGLSERMLNACVEVNNYEPVTLQEMIENNRIFRHPPDAADAGGSQ